MMKLMMLLENNANHDVEGRRVHPGRDQGGRGHQGHSGICWEHLRPHSSCTSSKCFWRFLCVLYSALCYDWLVRQDDPSFDLEHSFWLPSLKWCSHWFQFLRFSMCCLTLFQFEINPPGSSNGQGLCNVHLVKWSRGLVSVLHPTLLLCNSFPLDGHFYPLCTYNQKFFNQFGICDQHWLHWSLISKLYLDPDFHAEPQLFLSNFAQHPHILEYFEYFDGQTKLCRVFNSAKFAQSTWRHFQQIRSPFRTSSKSIAPISPFHIYHFRSKA